MKALYKEKTENLVWIDALKGIAICGVVLTHTMREQLPDNVEKILAFGANGVQLFFVISGFLIFSSYRKKNVSTRKWIVKRLVRLIPLYYLYLILSLIIDGRGSRYWLGTVPEISIWNIISNFLFINGLNPYYINSIGITWYIADLAIFIILIPFLSKIMNSIYDSVIVWLGGGIICSLIIRSLNIICPIADTYLWSDYLYICFLNQLPVFCAGIVAYWIVLKEVFPSKKGIYNHIIVCMAVLFIGQIAIDRRNVWGDNIYIG